MDITKMINNIEPEIIIRGKGFYKRNETELIYAPECVMSSEFILHIDEKDTYQYPIYGWYYFDIEDDAYLFFGIEKVIPTENNKITIK